MMVVTMFYKKFPLSTFLKQFCTAFLCMFCLNGCFTYTWVGGTYYFPQNSDHKTAQYYIYIEAHGAKRQAYNDKSKKEVFVTISNNQGDILSRTYEFTATALAWDVVWEKMDDLNVVFFDFAQGVTIYDKNASGLPNPAKQILALRFTYDSQSNSFIEYPVSSELVVQALQRKIKK